MDKVRTFFAGVSKEMKRVKWPTIKDMFKNTLITVGFCIFFCGFFYLIDLLFAFIKGLFV